MQPNVPQDQLPLSQGLPPVTVPAAGIPLQQPVPASVAPTPAQTGITPTAVALQAEQLIAQYRNDPYRLNMALQQLKATYLAEHFHIMPNAVEG